MTIILLIIWFLFVIREVRKKMAKVQIPVTAAMSSYLGALSFGYVIGFSSPALPLMQLAKEPMYKNSDAASWFGSVVTLGAMFGCPAAGWLVERVGRKMTLLVTSLPFLFGWIAISFGNSLSVLHFGRVLTGFASGMVCVVSPLYIAETSTKDLRGMLGSGVQLFITIGILMVYVFGNVVSWRALAFIGAVFPVVATIFTLRVPETPRYLLNTNQKNEALRSLLWLRGTTAIAEEECRDMEENTDAADEKISWSEFRKPELLRPLIVSVMVMIFQQLSGINVVMFYSVSICQSAGFSHASGFASVAIAAVQVVGTIVACFLMDRAGRRYLLIFAGFGMAVSCFMLGGYYHASVQTALLSESVSSTSASVTSSGLSWLALFSLMVYIMAFALGWGPIPMLLMSEIFPARARGAASAIASLTNWMFAFLVTKEFASLQNLLGMDGTFIFFGSCCFVAAIYVYRCVPETKGKSLEEIELYFLGRPSRGT